jgi:NitT/TauT family transport system ATP-binding protein
MNLSVCIDAKSYPRTSGPPVLEDLSFDIAPEERVALVGPSGCGKSTLLHIVAGLDSDFSGHVSWPEEQDHRLGYVFQNPRLLPWLTVRNNIRLVLDDPDSAARRIEELLAAMELAPFADYHPNRISVGMQRRVALARAFSVDPQLLLLDEPFVSLDQPTAAQLRVLLLRVWEQRRSRVLLVTHDLREATQLADRVLFLSCRPAGVIGAEQVEIPPELRADEEAVEGRYRELKRLFDTLYAGSGETAGSTRH